MASTITCFKRTGFLNNWGAIVTLKYDSLIFISLFLSTPKFIHHAIFMILCQVPTHFINQP